ncbi:MAG: hypothetical protein CM1200mP29_16290 [Verrucomicrobiota bacterium]|nr:MAG: hypothetical protein CM1200mP29_16290 [Verrucomicrobiota bacterium]
MLVVATRRVCGIEVIEKLKTSDSCLPTQWLPPSWAGASHGSLNDCVPSS